MEFREPRSADFDSLADVAERSMRATHGEALGEETVADLAGRWYDPDRVEELLAAEETIWRVADVDGKLAAFVQGGVFDTDPVRGEVDWIHVDPDAGEEGLAPQLLGVAQDAIEDRGADRLRAYVLAGNEDGRQLYEDNGFERVDEREATVEDETHQEYVYEKSLRDGEEEAVVETVDGGEAGELYVNYSAGDRGTESPVFPTFRTAELDEQYGWYCSNCGSTETNMGSMGRIKCQECGNMRKATRWDGAFL